MMLTPKKWECENANIDDEECYSPVLFDISMPLKENEHITLKCTCGPNWDLSFQNKILCTSKDHYLIVHDKKTLSRFLCLTVLAEGLYL